MVFSVSDVCIQHGQLLWCFQHQTYVYSMISYYGVFSIRRMYDCVQQVQLLSLAMAKPLGGHRNARRPSVHACVRASVRPSVHMHVCMYACMASVRPCICRYVCMYVLLLLLLLFI